MSRNAAVITYMEWNSMIALKERGMVTFREHNLPVTYSETFITNGIVKAALNMS